MALPVGVTTFKLRFGKITDILGDPMSTNINVRPSHDLVWEATGDRVSVVQVSSNAATGEIGEIDLPHTDQAGFVNLKGDAITDWWYTVESSDLKAGRYVGGATRRVQATSDITLVDLELVPVDKTVAPAGSVPLPAVTSVNGQTGGVTIPEVDPEAFVPRSAVGDTVAPLEDTRVPDANLPERLSEAGLNAAFARFDVKPGATNAQFIAAATAAKAAGRNVLSVAPGTYVVPDLHPDDILGLYVVGDGVTLTGPAFVYPFTQSEWASRGRAPSNIGGRGVVAFELDDGRLDHWTDVFPVAKELGITMSAALHTGTSTPGWYKEAWRHGWQLTSHLPSNIDSTSISLTEFESLIVESLDVIEAATGTRENIGLVYPQHLRNSETDRIASRYHSYGRGVASANFTYPRGQGHTWLTAARDIDSQLQVEGVHPDLLRVLEEVAASDGQIVLYWHYQRAASGAEKLDGLRALVKHIRALGMEIKNPDQVWGEVRLRRDINLDGVGVLSGGASKVAGGYRGNDCAKLPSGGTIQAPSVTVTPKPGMFTVLRAGYRAKTAGFTNGAAQGVRVQCLEYQRTLDSGRTTSGGTGVVGIELPASGTSQPEIDWLARRGLVYLQPSTVLASFRINATGITGGDAPLIDDIDIKFLGYESAVQYDIALNGITPVTVQTAVATLARCSVSFQPVGFVPAGQVTARSISACRLQVVSTNAADTGTVRVTVLPGPSYETMAPAATGA